MNRLERKTTATLLIAIFMISAFTVAMPIGAYTSDEYTVAVLEAADRLVEMQNTDGGFSWVFGSGTSNDNLLGITSMGILKAHELLDKAEYETALAKAYGYAYRTPECLRFPDVTFLVWLAEACSDASLLTAIDTEVTEETVTVQSILNLAETRWNDRLTALGQGDPTVMAEYLRDKRTEGLALWDLEAAVKAALALDTHFPGYKDQAVKIADVMYQYLQSNNNWFNMEDQNEYCYTLGLSSTIEAFSELGIHLDTARTLTDLLIDYQNELYDFWDEGEGLDPKADAESVQSTAYAVMALIAQGDEDALVAAKKGDDWLVYTQDDTGGWDPSYLGSGHENLEVNSEAAWALSCLVQVNTQTVIEAKSFLYNIYATSEGPGSITPTEYEGFKYGQPKTFTIKPEDYCYLSELFVDKSIVTSTHTTESYIFDTTTIGDDMYIAEHTIHGVFMAYLVSISVDPLFLDFGSVPIGGTAERIVTVTNTGDIGVKVDARLEGDEPVFFGNYLKIDGTSVSNWAVDIPFDTSADVPLLLDMATANYLTDIGSYSATLVFEITPPPPA